MNCSAHFYVVWYFEKWQTIMLRNNTIAISGTLMYVRNTVRRNCIANK